MLFVMNNQILHRDNFHLKTQILERFKLHNLYNPKLFNFYVYSI